MGSNQASNSLLQSTNDKLDKHLYDSNLNNSLFNKGIQKSKWGVRVPAVLRLVAGSETADFGRKWSARISRDVDMLLGVYLTIRLPKVVLSEELRNQGCSIRWCDSVMHQLVKKVELTFNGEAITQWDSTSLSFWSQFNVPAAKHEGYQKMIGNRMRSVGKHELSYQDLILPLPFFENWCIPIGSLAYTKTEFNFIFEEWFNLLLVHNSKDDVIYKAKKEDLMIIPELSNVQFIGTYNICSGQERKHLGMYCNEGVARSFITIAKQDICMTMQNEKCGEYNSGEVVHSIRLDCIPFFNRSKVNGCYFGIRNKLTNKMVSGVISEVFTKNIGQTELNEEYFPIPADYFSSVNTWFNAISFPTEPGFYQFTGGYEGEIDLEFIAPHGMIKFRTRLNPCTYEKFNSELYEFVFIVDVSLATSCCVGKLGYEYLTQDQSQFSQMKLKQIEQFRSPLLEACQAVGCRMHSVEDIGKSLVT